VIAQDDRLVDAVAAVGLPGALVELPDGPLPDDAWRKLLTRTADARTSGLLLAAVDRGSMPVTDSQREEALELHTGAMVQCLVLEALLLSTADFLDTIDVPFRVLKGSAVAHLDYSDPALRSFGDVDLLVRSEDFDRVAAALAGLGHQRLFRQPRPGFDRRFGKSTTFATSDHLEIDLHRTFVLGPFGLTVDLPRIWEASETFALGGRTLHALAPEARLMHAAYHAILGAFPARAQALRDVAEMLLFGGHDDRALVALSESWQADAVLARAVRLAWERFRIADVTRISAWATRHEPPTEQSRRLALYETEQSSYAAQSLAAVAVLPRFRDKVAFVRTLSLPDSHFLAEHMTTDEVGRMSWLLRGVRRRITGGRTAR
jgi:hypothetical protein